MARRRAKRAKPVSVRVDGADEILRNLNRLPPQVRRQHLLEAVKPGAEIIRQAIEEKAPRGEGDKEYKGRKIGHLADSIVVEGRVVDDDAVIYSIGPDKDHYYARWVEFGHALIKVTNRIKNAKGRTVKRETRKIGEVPPHPFMRPGYDSSKDDAERAVARELKRRLGL